MIITINFDHYENDPLADLYIAATLYRIYPKYNRLPKLDKLPLGLRNKLKGLYFKFKKMSPDSFYKMIRMCILDSKTKITITELNLKEKVVIAEDTSEYIGSYTTEQFDQYKDFYN